MCESRSRDSGSGHVVAFTGDASRQRRDVSRPPAASLAHAIYAFTLMELLVVISLVALLMAMILPSLQAARENARRIACLSNLRQLGVAANDYTAGNKDWWLYGSGRSWDANVLPHSPTWPRVLAKLMNVSYITEQSYSPYPWSYAPEQYPSAAIALRGQKQNGIFQCPSEHSPNYWGGNNSTSYAHNSGVKYKNGFGISDTYFFHPDPGPREAWRPIQATELLRPTTTFFLGETDQVQDLAGPGLGGWYDSYMNQFYLVTQGGKLHQGAGNYVWADGHAGSLPPDALTLAHFDRTQ